MLYTRFFVAVDGRERVPHAGDRVSRGFDDALDLVAGGQRGRAVEHAGLAGLDRFAEGLGGVALFRPSDPRQRSARLGHVEVGHADDVHAFDVTSLGQDHRAELARADQADPHRASGRGSRSKHCVEIHVSSFVYADEDA